MQAWPLKRARPPTIDRSSAKCAVAVQLDGIGEDLVHVVERVRPLRMARDLRDLPRRQLGVDVLGELLALLAEPVDLFGDVDGRLGLHVAQLFDLGLELRDRLLEIEEVSSSSTSSSSCCCARLPSVGDRQRVEDAPNIPSGDRRHGSQAAATSRASLRADRLAARNNCWLMPRDQADVVQRQHVRAAAGGRSGTSPPSSGRCRGCATSSAMIVLVVHLAPRRRHGPRPLEMQRQVDAGIRSCAPTGRRRACRRP